MTDKERLEEIKEKYSEVTVLEYKNDVEPVGVDIKDLVWLINRVEELELELEIETNDWRAEVQKWQKFYEESEESHLETKELLRSTIRENQRYKRALEEIARGRFSGASYKARKALEEWL